MTTTRTPNSTAPSAAGNDLSCRMDDRPACAPAIFAALQHVLASLVGFITTTRLMVSGESPFAARLQGSLRPASRLN